MLPTTPTHTCFCGAHISCTMDADPATGIANTNAAVRRHAFGRDFRVVRSVAGDSALVTWSLEMGCVTQEPCPLFAPLGLPSGAFDIELQHGVGRAQLPSTTRHHRTGPDPLAKLHTSTCFLCHAPFTVTVRKQDRASMAKRMRMTRPVCDRCSMWISARGNNMYAVCHPRKRTRRCTHMSVKSYTARTPSPCLVVKQSAFVREIKVAIAEKHVQTAKRRRRKPCKNRGSPADQKLAQIVLDAATTFIWSEVVAVRDSAGVVHTRGACPPVPWTGLFVEQPASSPRLSPP